MRKPLTIIVDADAIIALANPTDANHERAKAISTCLDEREAFIVFPATAVAESITTLQRKIGNPLLTAGVAARFSEGTLMVEAVDASTISHALMFFNPHGSKKNTFFDAIICAFAQKLDVDAIFSFDTFYDKQGFTLAHTFLDLK